MKRTLLFGGLFMALSLAGQHKPLYYQVADSLLNATPFQYLDTSSQISTGILWDRAVPNLSFAAYTGSNEDTVRGGNRTTFQPAIDLRRAALDSTLLPSYDSLSNRYRSLTLGFDALPIVIYDYQYTRAKNTAIANNLLLLDTEGNFVNNPNAAESPFEIARFFAAGFTSGKLAINDTLQFVFPSEFYFNNESEGVAQIQIDMADGQGYRTVSWNIPFQVYYAGEGGNDIEIAVKITYQNSTVRYSKMTKKTAQGCTYFHPVAGPWGSGTMILPIVGSQFVKYSLQSSLESNGAWGKAYVRYRANPAPGEQNKFRKPIILVEGIDFGSSAIYNSTSGQLLGHDGRPFSNSFHIGDAGWPTIWGCDEDYPFEKYPDFLNLLHANGYDVIMLDFYDGDDYMQRNGLLLAELINRINQHKVGNEQNVVVGVSMGGQVARYALTYMEANNMDHCVRLNVSFDSPWKGGNIPLAVQHFVKYMADLKGEAGAKAFQKKLNGPAAKQLLSFHYLAKSCSTYTTGNKVREIYCNYPSGTEAQPHSLRSSFLQELSNLGDYPKLCRNIAVANGDNDGSATFSNGKQFTEFVASPCGFATRTNLWALGRYNNMIADLDVPGVYRRKTFVSGLPMIDNSPGGQRGDIEDLAEAVEDGIPSACTPFGLTFTVTVHQDKSTFIPTVSALNLSTNNLNYNVQQINENNPSQNGLTHFDAYVAESSDKDHAEGTLKNLNWLYSQIDLGRNVLYNSQGSTLANKTWNVPLESSILTALDINSGGKLYVNANKPRFDLPNVSANYSPQNGLAKVFIGGACGGTEIVNVNSGGKLILAETGSTNRAYLYVADGAELRINSGGIAEINKDSRIIVKKGGKLVINGGGQLKYLDDAQVIVEDGGEIVYNQNGVIDLKNYGSVLTVQGKFSVGNNATFTFTGNGKLIFDQPIPWNNGALPLDDYYNIGTNAQIKLNGPFNPMNENHNLIQCLKPTYLRMEDGHTFKKVELRFGRVAMGPGALLFVYSPVLFTNMKFTADDPAQLHGGLRLWKNSGYNVIGTCVFEYGSPALLAHWAGGGSALPLQNCEFRNNFIGLQLDGGNVNMNLCNFHDNYTGISGAGMSGISSIRATDFDTHTWGLVVKGQIGSTLEITNSSVEYCYNGMLAEGIDVTGRCNLFGDNTNLGSQFKNANFHIEEEAGNRFLNNKIGIQLSGDGSRTGVYLNEGQNEFQLGIQGTNYIKGHVSQQRPNSNYVSANLIDADYNQMPLVYQNQAYTMPVNITYGSNATMLQLHIPHNLTSTTSPCGGNGVVYDNPYRYAIQKVSGNGGILIGIDYPEEYSFKQALLDITDSVSYSDEVLGDDWALHRCLQVLNSPLSNVDADSAVLANNGYLLMLKGLNNVYHTGNLQNNEGEPGVVNDTVQDVVTIINGRIGQLNPLQADYDELNFLLNLDKAQAYRVAGYYVEAMSVLNNSAAWTSDFEQTQRADYWKCITDAEKQYFEGLIEPEEMAYMKDACESQYAGYNYKTLPPDGSDGGISGYVVENQRMATLEFFPQPVREFLTAEISPSYFGEVNYRIIDIMGTVQKAGTAEWTGNQHTFPTKKFSKGAYILEIEFEKETVRKKFVKH